MISESIVAPLFSPLRNTHRELFHEVLVGRPVAATGIALRRAWPALPSLHPDPLLICARLRILGKSV
jgi:hypothetical protein